MLSAGHIVPDPEEKGFGVFFVSWFGHKRPRQMPHRSIRCDEPRCGHRYRCVGLLVILSLRVDVEGSRPGAMTRLDPLVRRLERAAPRSDRSKDGRARLI